MFLIFRDEVSPDVVTLSPGEIRHVRARRMRALEQIWVGDGKGLRRTGRLGKDLRTVELIAGATQTREGNVVLCTAIPDAGRWDWLLEKATEIGATRIVPVNFHRSVRKIFSRDRALRIVHAAASQACRFVIPTIDPIVASPDLFSAVDPDQVFILDPTGEESAGTARSCCVVGPEGGFTDDERQFFASKRTPFIRASESTLRVETAAIFGLALVLLSKRR